MEHLSARSISQQRTIDNSSACADAAHLNRVQCRQYSCALQRNINESRRKNVLRELLRHQHQLLHQMSRWRLLSIQQHRLHSRHHQHLIMIILQCQLQLKKSYTMRRCTLPTVRQKLQAAMFSLKRFLSDSKLTKFLYKLSII